MTLENKLCFLVALAYSTHPVKVATGQSASEQAAPQIFATVASPSSRTTLNQTFLNQLVSDAHRLRYANILSSLASKYNAIADVLSREATDEKTRQTARDIGEVGAALHAASLDIHKNGKLDQATLERVHRALNQYQSRVAEGSHKITRLQSMDNITTRGAAADVNALLSGSEVIDRGAWLASFFPRISSAIPKIVPQLFGKLIPIAGTLAYPIASLIGYADPSVRKNYSFPGFMADLALTADPNARLQYTEAADRLNVMSDLGRLLAQPYQSGLESVYHLLPQVESNYSNYFIPDIFGIDTSHVKLSLR